MFTKQLLQQLGFSLLLASLLVLSTQVRAAEGEAAGQLIFVHGDVTILRDEETLDAERGMDLWAGDEVTTAAAASAQIRFTDDSVVAIRPDSHYSLSSYSYDPDDAASGEQRSELLRGGLRAISGAIGQARPEQVEFETPVATMGIRGTDLQLLHIEPGAEGQYDGAPTGSYLNVQDGLVSMSNQGGEQLVSSGETFYVPDAATPPQPAPVEPEQLFSDAVPGTADDEATDDDTVAASDDDFAEPADTTAEEPVSTGAATTDTETATSTGAESADYSTESRTQQTALAIQDEEEQLPEPTPGEEPVWPADPDVEVPDDDDEDAPDPDPAPEISAQGANLTERGFLAQDDAAVIEQREDGSIARISLGGIVFEPHSDAQPDHSASTGSAFPGSDNMIYWGSYLPETYDLFADPEAHDETYSNELAFGYMYADHWFGTADQALAAMGEGGQFTFIGGQPSQVVLGDDVDLNLYQIMVTVDLGQYSEEQVSIEMPYFSEYLMAEGLIYGDGAVSDLYDEGIALADMSEVLEEGWFWGTFTGDEGIDGLMSSFWLNFMHPETEDSYHAWGNWFLARNCLQDLVNGQACNPLEVPLEPFTDSDHLFAGEDVLLAARNTMGMELSDNTAALGYAPDGEVPLLLAFLHEFGDAAFQVHNLDGVTGGADQLLSVDTEDGTMHITWGMWQADSYSVLVDQAMGGAAADPGPGPGETYGLDTNLHYIMVSDAEFDFSAATGTYTFTYESGSGLVSESDQSVVDVLEGQITVEADDGTMAVMLALDVPDDVAELSGSGDYADFLLGEEGLALSGDGYFTEGLLHGLAAGADAEALVSLLMAIGGESETTYQGALAFLQSDWEEDLEPAPTITEFGPNLTEHGFLAQDDSVELSLHDDGSIAAIQVAGVIFEPHSDAEPQHTDSTGTPFPGADNMVYWGSYLPETYDLFSDPDTHEPETFSNEQAFGYMYADHWYGTADDALATMGEDGRFTFAGGEDTRLLLGDDFDLNIMQAMVTVDLGQDTAEQVNIEMPYFSEAFMAEGMIYGDGAVADLYGDGIELFDLAELLEEGWFWGTFTGDEGIDGLMSSFWLNFLNPETEDSYTTWGNWFLARNCLQDLINGQACNPLDVPLTELARDDHLFASETALVAGRNSAGSLLTGGSSAWGHAPEGDVPMVLAMLQQFGTGAFQVHDLAGVTGGADNLLTVETTAGDIHISWGMWEAGAYSAVTQPGMGNGPAIVDPGPEPGEPVENLGLDSNLHYIMVSEADFDLGSAQGKFEFTYEAGSDLVSEANGDLIDVLEGKITVYADAEAVAIMLAFDTPGEVSELFGEGDFNDFLFGEAGLALTGDGYFSEGLMHGSVTGPEGDVLVALLQAIAADSEDMYQGALAFLQSDATTAIGEVFGDEYVGLLVDGMDLVTALPEESMAYLDTHRSEVDGTQYYLADFFAGDTRYLGEGSAADTPASSWRAGSDGDGALIVWGHYAPGEYTALDGGNPYTAAELPNDVYVHYNVAEQVTAPPEYDMTGEMNFSLLADGYEFGIYHTTDGMTHRLLSNSQISVDFGDFSDAGTYVIDLQLEDVGGTGMYHYLTGSASVDGLYQGNAIDLTVDSDYFDEGSFQGLFVGDYYDAILALLGLAAGDDNYVGQSLFVRDPGTWFDMPEIFEAPDFWYDGLVMTHSDQNRQNLLIEERDITLYFADYSEYDMAWRLWGYHDDDLDRTREHPGPNPSDFAGEVIYIASDSLDRDVEVNWGYWEEGSYRNEGLSSSNESRMHWLIASDITPFDTDRTLPEGSREYAFAGGSDMLSDSSDWVFTLDARDSGIEVDFDNATMAIDLFFDSADTNSTSHLSAQDIDLHEFWDPSTNVFLEGGSDGLQNGFFEGTFVGPEFEGIMSILEATYPGEGSFRGSQIWEQLQ